MQTTAAPSTTQVRVLHQQAPPSRAHPPAGETIRGWILDAFLPQELAAEVLAAYHTLCEREGADTTVAVRSSATAEDLPGASFAGQQEVSRVAVRLGRESTDATLASETYLNVSGDEHLLRTFRRVLASLYTDRAISYRVKQGFAHEAIALSVGAQAPRSCVSQPR
jgi:pyruvate,water dikinase